MTKSIIKQLTPIQMGLLFSTIFAIMFISSLITQNTIGGLDINQITNDIQEEFQVVCETSGLPQVDVELCENTLNNALDEARRQTNIGLDRELNFFIKLFFPPEIQKLIVIVMILFVIGFMFRSLGKK